MNAAFCKIIGYQAEDVIGHLVTVITRPQDAKHLTDLLHTLVQSQESMRVDLTIYCKNGRLFDAELALSVIANGHVSGIVCILHDISDRKRAENELQAILKEQKELGELRLRFSSMVTHEFRTPLAIIYSSIDTLKYYSNRLSDEHKNQRLDQIQEQVNRLDQLLDDYLSISRLDQTEPNLQLEWVDITSFCQKIIKEIQVTAGSRQLSLSVNHIHEPQFLDAELMRQIIINLLSNAVKYSPDETVVNLIVDCDLNNIIIYVQDQGIGIPDIDQEHLFESFHRAHNVGSVKGTGLGLSIVKRAVELQGGTITCESNISIGTTFTVTIPTKVPDQMVKQ